MTDSHAHWLPSKPSQCWIVVVESVVDGGPTSIQRWVNVSCFLGSHVVPGPVRAAPSGVARFWKIIEYTVPSVLGDIE